MSNDAIVRICCVINIFLILQEFRCSVCSLKGFSYIYFITILKCYKTCYNFINTNIWYFSWFFTSNKVIVVSCDTICDSSCLIVEVLFALYKCWCRNYSLNRISNFHLNFILNSDKTSERFFFAMTWCICWNFTLNKCVVMSSDTIFYFCFTCILVFH